MMINGRLVTLGRTGDTSAEPEGVRLLLLHDNRWGGLCAGAGDDFVALRVTSHDGDTVRAMSCFGLGI